MGKLEDYSALRQAHPELFDNPPDSGYSLLLDEQEIREAEAEMQAWLTQKGYPASWGEVGIAYQDPFYSSCAMLCAIPIIPQEPTFAALLSWSAATPSPSYLSTSNRCCSYAIFAMLCAPGASKYRVASAQKALP